MTNNENPENQATPTPPITPDMTPEVPQVEVPQVEVPQVAIPQVEVPQVEVPQVAMPQVAIPQVVPQVEVPQEMQQPETQGIPAYNPAPVGYNPIPTGPPQGGPPQGPPQGPRKVRLPIILIGLSLVLALVLLLALNPIRDAMARSKLKNDPRTAINNAFDKSVNNIDSTPFSGPNFSQFKNKATNQNVVLSFGEMSEDSYYNTDALENMALDLTFQHNAQNEELFSTISFTSPYINIKDNKFFVSPGAVLLSAPLVYSDHEYISINPETFVDDWNTSEYGSGFYSIPEDIDIPEIISNYFAMGAITASPSDELTKLQAELTDKADKITDTFRDSIVYSYVGEDDKEFEMQADIKAGDIEKFIFSMGELLEDSLYESNASSEAISSLFYQYSYELDEVFTIFNEVEVLDDVVFSFFIDKKHLELTRIKAKDIAVTTTTNASYDESLEISFDLVLAGEEYLMDDMTCDIDLTFVDSYYESRDTVKIKLSHAKPSAKGIAGSVWKAVIRADNQTMTLTSDFSWDKQSKSDTNMSWELSAKSKSSYSEQYALRLDGVLEEKSGKITLSNGIISVLEDKSTIIKMNLDYAMEVISNKSLHPASKDTVDFFDVDWDEINERLGNMLS